MFHFQVDLGQILIMVITGIIGWSVVNTINRIYTTLDSHEKTIQDLIGKVNYLIGQAKWRDGNE